MKSTRKFVNSHKEFLSITIILVLVNFPYEQESSGELNETKLATVIKRITSVLSLDFILLLMCLLGWDCATVYPWRW